MTPDDVVARARELVGQEVHLTVRGVVHVGGTKVWLEDPHNPYWIQTSGTLSSGPRPGLVSIQPAPLRIEPHHLYVDAAGNAYEGSGKVGCVWTLGVAKPILMGPGEERPLPDGLRPAKAVPA